MLRFCSLTPDYAEVTGEELLGLCAEGGNAPAWEEFLRRFHPLIISIVTRTARRYTPAYAQVVEDLAQDVYLKLNAKGAHVLRRFQSRHPGSSFSYIKVITANVVHDHFKHTNPIAEQELPADLRADQDTERQAFLGEIDALLHHNASEIECRIFWLRYRQGLTAKEIAGLPGVPLKVKGVESLLARLCQLVREKLEGKPPPRSFSKKAAT
jgi:RNA polymerase sigma factor (sigma-70 family)